MSRNLSFNFLDISVGVDRNGFFEVLLFSFLQSAVASWCGTVKRPNLKEGQLQLQTNPAKATTQLAPSSGRPPPFIERTVGPWVNALRPSILRLIGGLRDTRVSEDSFGFLPAASACWSISTSCKKVVEEQTTNHSFKSEGDQIFQKFLVAW